MLAWNFSFDSILSTHDILSICLLLLIITILFLQARGELQKYCDQDFVIRFQLTLPTLSLCSWFFSLCCFCDCLILRMSISLWSCGAPADLAQLGWFNQFWPRKRVGSGHNIQKLGWVVVGTVSLKMCELGVIPYFS